MKKGLSAVEGANMRPRWQQLLETWKVPQGQIDSSYDDIVRRYSQDRVYHNLDHIEHVLQTVDTLAAAAARNLPAIELAAWLHDVIYDTRAADNEGKSAEYAIALCAKLGIPVGSVVGRLILATKTHQGEDPDAWILLDADLAILGSAANEYSLYARKIRQEYGWVPEAPYRQGRIRVLESFLAREQIFNFLTNLEEPARQNLRREIEQLRTGN